MSLTNGGPQRISSATKKKVGRGEEFGHERRNPEVSHYKTRMRITIPRMAIQYGDGQKDEWKVTYMYIFLRPQDTYPKDVCPLPTIGMLVDNASDCQLTTSWMPTSNVTKSECN